MPSQLPHSPESNAPLDRLTLNVASARSAQSADAHGVQFGFCACVAEVEASNIYGTCICFAEDVEASSMYSPPGMCFAEEA